MNSTLDRIAAILDRELGIDPVRVTPGARINEVLSDSLDQIELYFQCEGEFGIALDEQDPIFDTVGTFGEFAAAIDTLTKRAA